MTGLVHIYTGDGKGKTTAAMGLGLRCAGRLKKVVCVQFLKCSDTGEIFSTQKLDGFFEIHRFEKPHKFFWLMNDDEKKELKKDTQKALDFCLEILKKDECQMLILDEIFGCVSNELVKEEDVLNLINAKNTETELVLTGRNAPQKIIDAADYVSEIRCIKHPAQSGTLAREGIEY